MILYHGSDVVVTNPKLLATEKGKDFGIAFYLTPIKDQAERMAKRKAKLTAVLLASSNGMRRLPI